MDSSTPKVSFIPKGSLVREESFLERSRPRSAIGLVAGFIFVVSVSAYIGLYYYNNSLNKLIAEKTIAIKEAQKEFSDAPEVGEAKVFRARADLAREILNAHTVASPIFTFLSQNTTESILYDKFSFTTGPEGAVLELSGEAPSYAALAYQADVFREKNEQLSNFLVSNVALSKFGTVSFSFTLRFIPSFLLYTNNVGTVEGSAPAVSTTADTVTSVTTKADSLAGAVDPDISAVDALLMADILSAGAGTSTASIPGDWALAPVDTPTTTAVSAEKQSVLRSLWSKFKFW